MKIILASSPAEAAALAGGAPAGTPAGAVAGSISANFDATRIFKDVRPSIVSVLVDGDGGSGFFVDTAGHIVTNYHVVEPNLVQGLDAVIVIGADGVQVDAEVLGFDRANDLAVLRVDPAEIAVRPVILGDSSAAQVGEPVVALGNPFGLEGSLSVGVVSAVERTRGALQQGGRPQRDLIQTDATINPGNSGGVLVNARGEVIGVTNSVESPVRGSVGIGFAVPANVVARFLPEMIAGENIAHPWIGIVGDAGSGGTGLRGDETLEIPVTLAAWPG